MDEEIRLSGVGIASVIRKKKESEVYQVYFVDTVTAKQIENKLTNKQLPDSISVAITPVEEDVGFDMSRIEVLIEAEESRRVWEIFLEGITE